MARLDHLPPLREVISRFGLDARKALGQNFLLDLNLTAKIARGAGDLSGVTVCEVGPGPGGLTRALVASSAARIIAVERDPRFITALQELIDAADGRLTLIQADALEVDLAALAPAPRAVVANLPYNVATPLLIGWLKNIDAFRSLTLMFQREVAERIVAAPRTDHYGRLAVMSQWLCHARILFDLPPQAFTPPPKITSSVVHLTPRERPAGDPSFGAMERVVAAAFGQRRKMLRSSLSSLDRPEPLLEEAGLPPTARAEEIDVEGFVRLANAWERRAAPGR